MSVYIFPEGRVGLESFLPLINEIIFQNSFFHIYSAYFHPVLKVASRSETFKCDKAKSPLFAVFPLNNKRN